MYKLPTSLTEEILSFDPLIDAFQRVKIESLKLKESVFPLVFTNKEKLAIINL